jgi:regulator of cell morphogenesis and NO signaling
MGAQMQNKTGFEAQTVGAIAAGLPGATAVFRRYKLDFCCGGDVPLGEAALAKGIPINEITSRLAALDTGAAIDAPSDAPALIDHILTRYHDVHRRELPELVRLARRVEARHEGHPYVPAGLADTLEEMLADLGQHMVKEETILFPMMRAGGAPMIGFPIARMRAEHVEHGERLRKVELLTNGCQPPPDACNSWLALYAGVRKLVDDLMQHIHLENNVLFPQFASGEPVLPVCMGPR